MQLYFALAISHKCWFYDNAEKLNACILVADLLFYGDISQEFHFSKGLNHALCDLVVLLDVCCILCFCLLLLDFFHRRKKKKKTIVGFIKKEDDNVIAKIDLVF